MPEQVATVAVLGSCISRDNFNSRFNPTYKRWYACPLHQNQSSLIALMSEPVDVAWEPTREMSDYDRWNVGTDLSRSFLREVVELQPDLLVLDFFGDIHFGVVQVAGGPYVTDNRWKTRHTTWYAERLEAGDLRRITLLDDEEEYLSLWRDALRRFAAFAATELPSTRLVVHHGHNTPWVQQEDGSLGRLKQHRRIARLPVARANALWAQLDQEAAEALSAAEIDLTGSLSPTYDDHPWGSYYVHYVPDYYHRFLGRLHGLVLDAGLVGDPAVVAELQAEMAVAEREGRRLQAERRRARKVLRDASAGD